MLPFHIVINVATILADVTDTAKFLKVTKKSKTPNKGKATTDSETVKFIKLLPPGSTAPGKLST